MQKYKLQAKKGRKIQSFWMKSKKLKQIMINYF